jgi:hypothetical protein
MKRRLSVLMLLLVGSMTGAGCIEEGTAAEGSFERTLSVTGRLDLDVSTGSGDIRVRTGGTSSVRISGLIRARSDGSMSGEERVRYLMANPPIEQTGSLIRIGNIADRTYRNRISISYEIVVPEDTRLNGRTGSGDMVADGLRGHVDASTGSGNIKLNSITGDVKARTGSGNIDGTAIRGYLSLNTGSGDIRMLGIAGNSKASTGSGSINLQMAETGDVDVSTGSGDVTVDGVKGGLVAGTGSGNISLTGEPTGSWRAHSSSGNVEIRLGPGTAFTLDAHTSSGKVTTNHPLTIMGKVSAKELRGTVRGGGPVVELRTSSGDITIQ